MSWVPDLCHYDDENYFDSHQKKPLASHKSQQTDPTQKQEETQTSPMRYLNMDPSQPLDSLNEEDEEGASIHEDEPQHFATTNENINTEDIEGQVAVLRNLLQIERHSNETRRQNNFQLQKYLQQLQTDYLRQQQDLIEALELSNKIKEQKDSQLAIVDETLKEKDQLIVQLRQNLANLDEPKLRMEFQQTLEKQKKLAQLEQDQLREQISSVEQQLVRERVSNSQLLQQFQEKLDDQVKFHEREVANIQSRLAQSQSELDRIMNEPQNLVIKVLREDKCKLESQVEELNLVLEDSKSKYESLKKRIESLSSEQEQSEQRNQEELDRLQQQYIEQRRQINELKLELEDKQEIMQILQYNLQRSEKRVKNLLGAIKGKETAYKEMLSQMELKHEQEIEKSTNSMRNLEQRLIEMESQMDKKQNELVKLQLWQENQSESMRNDRDERINRLIIDKTRFEKELQTAEIKLARECEQTKEKAKLIEQLQKDVSHFKEESKRLSIELTKSEAKLYAKQQELQAAIKQSQEDLRQQSAARESDQQVQQLSFELEEARKHSKRLERSIENLKKDNEKLSMKVRIADTNLSKMSSAINREHTRMLHEYEKKLEQIRAEQCAFDSSKMRYKRYGYKLKKYCEHLREVHEHLCNPSVCGYVIGSTKCPNTSMSSPSLSKKSRRDSQGTADKTSSIGFGSLSEDLDESTECPDCEAYAETRGSRENDMNLLTQQAGDNNKRQQPERFVIKRTSLLNSSSPNKMLTRRNSIRKSSSRPLATRASGTFKNPLKPIDNQLASGPRSSDQAKDRAQLNAPVHEHKYYYINEDSFDECCSTSPRGRVQRAVI